MVLLKGRYFIGLDGCHLKGVYDEILLSVISLDVNSGIFSITLCVYKFKYAETWNKSGLG